MRLRPSYQQGFARNAADAKYAHLWRGLVGAWCPCLGPTGNQLVDLSGYGNHAAFNGTVTWTVSADTDSASSPMGYAISMTGTNDDCECPQRVIDTSLAHSYAIWINRAADGEHHHLIFAGSSQSRLRVTQNDVLQYRTNADGTQTATTIMSADGWTHCGCSFDGATVRVYINGEEEAFENKSASTGTTAHSISEATTSAMNGLLDDVRIYNRCLSAAEFRLLHKIGRAGAYERRDVFPLAGDTEVAAPGTDQEVLHRPKLVESLVLGHLVG